ncbi:MAG TPA: DUF488 family protein [Rhodanobacteraceae bacterium]|nr:DUF488 family protein [Rhodanobacteraceae bacterium]
MIKLKRVYEKPASGDGFRVLVDRLWPRGVSKVAAHVDRWLKEVAPSTGLRRWFGHDPSRWTEFRTRYFAELELRADAIAELRALIAENPVTFVYAAKDPEHTHALALKDFVERKPKRASGRKTTKRPLAKRPQAAPRRRS